MVYLDFDDEIWFVYRKSWMLLGKISDEDVVEMLQQQMWEEANSIIEDARKDPDWYSIEDWMKQELGIHEESQQE